MMLALPKALTFRVNVGNDGIKKGLVAALAGRLRFASRVAFLFISPMSSFLSEAECLVLDKLAGLRVKARELYGVNIKPTVSYDLKGLAAGQANYQHNRIRLNRELLEKYAADFIAQTVPHEFAHLVAYQKFGRRIKPHGSEWKSVMVALGAEPSRTHSFKVAPTRRLRRFLYQCNCPSSSYELTSVRHNRIQRGHIYLCNKCGSSLRLPPRRLKD
jgi:SprT protein